MVFIKDGCSFHYAHTWSKSGFSICSRHLVTSKITIGSALWLYLHDGDDAGDHDDEVGQPPVVPQASRDYAER